MKIRFKELVNPLALLALTALATVACKNNGDGPSGESAWVKMEVQTKAQISFPASSGEGIDLTQLTMPSADECTVEFAAEGADPITKLYSEMKAGAELPIGNYKVKASYGENPAAAWNNAYFEANGELTLSHSQQEANLKLECGLKSAFAFAKFDDKFRVVFKDFSVAFSTEFNAKEPLVFKDGETKIASFKEAEKLWVVVTATKKENGKTYTYGIDPVMGLKGGDLHVFNFTVQDGDAAFTVNIDNGVNVVDKTVKLDPTWVDVRYTKMFLSYDQNQPVLFVAGMKSSKTYDVVVTSNLGLKNFFIDLDEEFAKELGVSSFDMLNLTAEQKTLVDQKIGAVMTYNPESNGYRMNLSGCKDKLQLRGGLTQYNLGVRYVDNSGNTESCKMDISMIEIKTDAFNDKRVWNRFAYIPAPYIVGLETATLMEVPFEYWIKEGEGEWKSLGIRNDKKESYIYGLKPNTVYQTKVMFESFVVAEAGFKTMPESFIENGGFEANSTFSYAGRDARVGAEFDGWVTTNATTTMNKTSDQYYKSYPSVRLADGHSGKGALIQTVGWGSSAVFQHWIKNNALWTDDGFNITKDRAIAGKLSWLNESGVQTSAMPNKMTFYYSYTSKQSNSMIGRVEVISNGEVIGSGELVTDAVGGLTNQQQITIKYNKSAVTAASGVLKTPTQIKVWFSSKSSDANLGDVDDSNKGNVRASKGKVGSTVTVDVWDARFEGSTLVIDDVQLTYPNNINEYTFE